MYRNIENIYIRKNIFSVKYLCGGHMKEINLMFDDDYDFTTFDFSNNFENFNYSNGYLSVKFKDDFFLVKSNDVLLVKVYAPKEVRKQIKKDVEQMDYFDLGYRKHFKDKYSKTIKEVWLGVENTNVYTTKEYRDVRKKAIELSTGKKEFTSIHLSETALGISYVVSNRRGEPVYAGTIDLD